MPPLAAMTASADVGGGCNTGGCGGCNAGSCGAPTQALTSIEPKQQRDVALKKARRVKEKSTSPAEQAPTADAGSCGAPTQAPTSVEPKQQRDVALKKARKMKEKSTSSAEQAPTADDGEVKEKKPRSHTDDRYVWDDYRHSLFVEAYEELGDDAVSKKIQEKMNLKGESITREQVSSHLQKYRLTIAKQTGQKWQKRQRRLAKQAQEEDISNRDAAAGAASEDDLHPLPPPPAAAAAADVPVQQPQTPPIFLSSNDGISVATALLHQQLDVPVLEVEPIQQCFAPPPHQFHAAARRRLIMEEPPARLQQQQVAAAGSGGCIIPMPMNQNRLDVAPAAPAMTAHLTIRGEWSAAEANMRDEEADILRAKQLQIAASTADAAVPEPAAVAGSSTSSSPDSVLGQFWTMDDPEPSWDFLGLPVTR